MERSFNIYSIIWRFLQFIWRYLQIFEDIFNLFEDTVETRLLEFDGTRGNTSSYPKFELNIGSLRQLFLSL